MKIETTEVSGIASAIKWMRLPMKSEGDTESYQEHRWLDVAGIYKQHLDTVYEVSEVGSNDNKLAKKLAKCKSGSGHDSFLKGIVVHAEFTATHDFILQLYRYHFRDTVSSESKMHMITKGGSIGDNCSRWVNDKTIDTVDKMIDYFNEYEILEQDTWCLFDNNKKPANKQELFECIIHNTPLGYMLTFGEVTNYLQLKSMYKQRKNHKMSGWSQVFVEWIKTLPLSYLITGEEVSA